MQIPYHSKVNSNALCEIYFHWDFLAAMPIFLCICLCYFVFLSSPPLRAKVPVLSTLSNRMLLCWEFVLIDLKLVDIY